MGSPFSHCAVLGAECLSSLYPRPLNGNLKSLAESGRPGWIGVPPPGRRQGIRTHRVRHEKQGALRELGCAARRMVRRESRHTCAFRHGVRRLGLTLADD